MTKTLEVTEEDLGLRLDKLLGHHFPDHSRTYFQYLIDQDFVLLNGHPVKKQHKVKKGDQVEVEFHLLAPYRPVFREL